MSLLTRCNELESQKPSINWDGNHRPKRVLMKDVHTGNQYLRLQVQWALGRVSSDDDVVDVLLENMETMPIRCFATKPPVLWPMTRFI